mmetsp:Transcript_6891/g.9904  ORF Transcript_6891/g.9904 Transcript_6891/m.9904 type:complete len:482 (-) Transcript_6891:661-2106(-)
MIRLSIFMGLTLGCYNIYLSHAIRVFNHFPAFVVPFDNQRSRHVLKKSQLSCLEASDKNWSQREIRRVSISGISVSPSGFLILLSTNHISQSERKCELILPLRLTSNSQDSVAATSPESLTICQLLSGVDLAGAILPPNALEAAIGLFCFKSTPDETNDTTKTSEKFEIVIEDELGLNSSFFVDEGDEKEFESIQKQTKDFVQRFLSQTLGGESYLNASIWQRNQAIFPKSSLDSVKIDLPYDDEKSWYSFLTEVSTNEAENGKIGVSTPPLKFVLECRIDGDKPLDIPFYSEVDILHDEFISKHVEGNLGMTRSLKKNNYMLKDILYSYDSVSSGSFLAMALALRYKCPIVITVRALEALFTLQHMVSSEKIKSKRLYCFLNEDISGSNINGKDVLNEEIKDALPQWRSIDNLQQQSERVTQNIEQAFEVTKLQSALKIAKRKKDLNAIKKIQAEIDKITESNFESGDSISDGEEDFNDD